MKFLIALLAAISLCQPLAHANDLHEGDRQQLLQILGDIEKGINDANIDLMAKHIDESAIVTWLNAETSQGPDGVRTYFKRMVGNSSDAVLAKYVTHPKIDRPARFYGDIAVANGSTTDIFTPHNRSPFSFDSKWTATLQKTNGAWKIVSLNLSTNAFNNALTAELERYMRYAALLGILTGALLVGGWTYLRRRKMSRAQR